MVRYLLLVALAAMPTFGITDRYSRLINDAAAKYMPATEIDEAGLLRAVLQTESGMNPDAVSPAGAQGLAQFMPGTWADVVTSIGDPDASPFEVASAIPGAAFYLGQLYSKWVDDRSDRDRWSLALASYNAGFGNILKAQDKCGGCPQYSRIIMHLPAVTGSNHSGQTINYVLTVWETYDARGESPAERGPSADVLGLQRSTQRDCGTARDS